MAVDLTKFCAIEVGDDRRKQLLTPFTQVAHDGMVFRCATDGAVGIVMPIAKPTNGHKSKAATWPPILNLRWSVSLIERWLPWPRTLKTVAASDALPLGHVFLPDGRKIQSKYFYAIRNLPAVE